MTKIRKIIDTGLHSILQVYFNFIQIQMSGWKNFFLEFLIQACNDSTIHCLISLVSRHFFWLISFSPKHIFCFPLIGLYDSNDSKASSIWRAIVLHARELFGSPCPRLFEWINWLFSSTIVTSKLPVILPSRIPTIRISDANDCVLR